jgi:dihydrofolate synthase/folylpolyglutamate synthase
VPVVIGENHQETRPVFEAKAKEMEAPIIFAEDAPEVVSAHIMTNGGMLYTTKHLGELEGDLGGIYQQKNLNTALFALKQIALQGYLSPLQKDFFELKNGLKNVITHTGLMGRWQQIQDNPQVVCDTGHNVGGWEYISQQLALVKKKKMHIVFGMVNDKDIESVVKLLPANALYYFTRANNSRSIPEETLRLLALQRGIYGATFHTVEEAYKAAQHAAKHDDFIFIGGSNYIVGEFLKKCI